MNGANSNYGHKAILASYADVPDELPIWGILQHGWTPFDGWQAGHRLPPRVPRLVWSKSTAARRISERIRAPYVVVGSPFAYLIKMNYSQPPPIKNGTIAFPHHSAENVEVRGSHDRYAKDLLDREGRGVTICLYHLDWKQSKIRDAYERLGHRVVTVGTSRNDRFYLARWLNLVGGHASAVSNRMSTALLYSSCLGLESKIYGDPMEVHGASEKLGSTDPGHDLLKRITGSGETVPQSFAQDELGMRETLTPQDLKAVLGWSGVRARLSGAGLSAALIARDIRRVST